MDNYKIRIKKMKNLAIVFCMGLVFSISTSMAFGYVQFYAAFKRLTLRRIVQRSLKL